MEQKLHVVYGWVHSSLGIGKFVAQVLDYPLDDTLIEKLSKAV